MADRVLRAAGSALRHYTTQKSKDDIASAMRAALAERDRQWLERLEHVGETDLDGNFFAHDPLPDGTKVYRIKEQG